MECIECEALEDEVAFREQVHGLVLQNLAAASRPPCDWYAALKKLADDAEAELNCANVELARHRATKHHPDEHHPSRPARIRRKLTEPHLAHSAGGVPGRGGIDALKHRNQR